MFTAKLTKSRLNALICAVLALGTFALYLPVRHNGFTNFDDDGYITGNTHINTGLNWPNIVWGFTHVQVGYWIPLTWISHMIDCQLFGLNAGGHHLVSVLFHIANTLLLFGWMNQLTGATWRSAFVAALFAWHPMHVESVAWACERKDVLSALFWLLTLITYSNYVLARSVSNPARAALNFCLALLFFACGLMSKPMVVTLPCVLLLVDFWPLQRLSIPALRSFSEGGSALQLLLLEKIPFFALAAIGSAIGFLTQTVGGAVSGDAFSFRLMNALGSYVRYISKLFWPTDLAVFYPFPNHGMLLMAIIGLALLGVCSVAFIVLSKRWPYLFTGWFWFLGTLVPVIGIIQAGSQSMADRFSYIPSIGLFILVAWGSSDFFESYRVKTIPAIAAIAVLAACIVLTSIQIKYWLNNVTLFQHALDVTAENYVAYALVGQALDANGRDVEALPYCRKAVEINPDYPPGEFFYGVVLWKNGDIAEASNYLNTATQMNPRDPVFEYKFGEYLAAYGSQDAAAGHFGAAIEDRPDFAEAHNALGKAFLKEGKLSQAADQLSQASTLQPANAQFHYDLGTILLASSQPAKAISEFFRAVQLKPDFVQAHENLAVAFANQGLLNQAITHFSEVAQLQPNDPDAWFNLGFAYLNNHQPNQAAPQFLRELRLSPNETKAHYRLAQALAQQSQLPQAVAEYRQTLRLTPDFSQAQKELDDILAAHPQLR